MDINNMKKETRKELLNYIIDSLQDLKGSHIYGCDLHNQIFNTDYYIIGTWKAEQWLANDEGIFNAIGIIKEYEESNFGQISTDLSNAENVCNMLVYIYGEELLQESELLRDLWNDQLADEDLTNLINQFNNL